MKITWLFERYFLLRIGLAGLAERWYSLSCFNSSMERQYYYNASDWYNDAVRSRSMGRALRKAGFPALPRAADSMEFSWSLKAEEGVV
jgi:hypothetical protein